MARYGKKHCRICGGIGHNARTCKDPYAVDLRERKAARKRQMSEVYGEPLNNRKCGQCGQVGHNVKTCPEAKELKSKAISILLRQAKIYCKIMNKIGLQQGALVAGKSPISLEDTNGWYVGVSEPTEKLYLFEKIDWSKFQPVTESNPSGNCIGYSGTTQLFQWRIIQPQATAMIKVSGEEEKCGTPRSSDNQPRSLNLSTFYAESFSKRQENNSSYTVVRQAVRSDAIVDLDNLNTLKAEVLETTDGSLNYDRKIFNELDVWQPYSVVSGVYSRPNKITPDIKKLLTSDAVNGNIRIERRKKMVWDRDRLTEMEAFTVKLEKEIKG